MLDSRKYFTTDEIRRLSARSDLMGVWLVVHCSLTMAAAICLFAIWPNPLTFVGAIVVIGSRQLGLAILMHDAAHRALFKTGGLNEWVGQWFCGHAILADLKAYRHYHLTHHKHTQTDLDPDLVLSKPFPTTRASLIRKFIRDLRGQTGIKQTGGQIAKAFKLAFDKDAIAQVDRSAQSFKGSTVRRPLVVNAVLFGVLWLVGAWWWWFAFWLLPLLTWYQLVLRIRNIAEHGETEFSEDKLRNVRTTLANPLMRLVVAPYWVNYHLEHHLVMHVPCWRLPQLHRLMLDQGYGDKIRVAPGYFSVMRKVGWSAS
jgi:fatty acid desaturase